MRTITIPDDLLPADGRFGSGPSKVRREGLDVLADVAPTLLGTSHRQAPVRDLVRRIRSGLTTFFSLPDGYDVALGNGGATLFWDAACQCLVGEQSAHAVFGEFSSKFAAAVRTAPHLKDPIVVESAPGTHPLLEAVEGVDAYALTHCETSTGVAMPVQRPAGAGGDALVLVDATSGAGGLVVDPDAFDAYYFSPQKSFGSEGGLWLALLSPAAIDRLTTLAAERPVPAMLDLAVALENSRKDQTYNTPAIATLLLMAEQLDWMNERGGLAWAAASCAAKAGHVYSWAQEREWTSPFVVDPAQRSNVVATVDLDPAVDAGAVSATLRAHGIVDVDAYRKLGRNQLRLALFPAVELADVQRLTTAIDHVADALAAGPGGRAEG
jgi:phosphoserine aminotransferase